MAYQQVKVTFTFDVGLLNMKRDYVVPVLHQACMEAFTEAQKKAAPNLSCTIEITLPPDGEFSILNKCMEEE